MFATNFLRTILKKKIRWLLASLFPDFFVSKAFAFLTTPMQHKIRPHEIIQLENAQKERFLYLHFDIQLYQYIYIYICMYVCMYVYIYVIPC